MAIDTNKLEQSLEKRDFDAVRKMVDEVVAENMSEKERGAVLVDFAETYMDIMNSLNEKYKEVLQEAIKGMGMIDRAESNINDKARILELKASLKK